MELKRKIYEKILSWKNTSRGQTALLIEGARRIGKSTIAEKFAKENYKSYVIIDFAIVSKKIKDSFNENANKLDILFQDISLEYNVRLYNKESLIIFDEVQRFPKAREMIKYLVKDGRYDYIETGSLISIKENVENIVIPSEEEKIKMYPLDFEEFLVAANEEILLDYIKDCFDKKIPLKNEFHKKAMRLFNEYILVGGMPQAVNEYIETNNFSKVDQMKRSILELYQDDFRKIDSSGRASIMFSAIPSELAKNTSRYQISSVIPNEKQDRVLGIVTDMKDSLTINLAYHANDPSAGMSLHEDITKYKMFISDTGLFTTLAFMDKDFTENIIYEKLLSDKLDTDLGYLYENMVAQMLYALGNKLFYYTFPKDNSTHNYEIDFLISKRNKICPIEVKSSGYKTHASIDEFIKKFSNKTGERYLIYTKDLRKDGELICIPIYMTMFL